MPTPPFALWRCRHVDNLTRDNHKETDSLTVVLDLVTLVLTFVLVLVLGLVLVVVLLARFSVLLVFRPSTTNAPLLFYWQGGVATSPIRSGELTPTAPECTA